MPTRLSRLWQVPPGWPEPPAGWSPPPGWEPLPEWPEPPARWKWWKRTRAGRVRLAALAGAGAVVVVAAVSATAFATAAVAHGLLQSANGKTITVVNDTDQHWQAVACTSEYFPDGIGLAPRSTWVPDGWPIQDDDGAGCYFAKVDPAGHLGAGVCLYVPQFGTDVFRLSEAHPSSLAECMDRSNPYI